MSATPTRDCVPACWRYDVLRPYAAHWNVAGWRVVCHTAVTQLLGLLAGVMREWDLAVQYFDAAVTAHDREGAVTAQVHTLHNYAHMLLARGARGDRAHSRQLITRGLELVTESELTHLADKLTRLATASRS